MYRFVLRRLIGDADYRSFRAIALVTKLQRMTGSRRARVLRDRMRYLLAVLSIPLRIRFRRRRQSDRMVYLLEPSASGQVEDSRRYFIRQNFGLEAQALHWQNGIPVASFPDLLEVAKTVWLCLRIAAHLDVADLPALPLWKFQMHLLLVKLTRAGTLFLFNFDHIDIYLLTRALGKESDVKVCYLPSNSTLAQQARYGVYERVTLLTCAPPQVEEVRSFQSIGWLKLKDVELIECGSLFAWDTKDMPRQPVFDVAFYSSGEWASRDGLLRVEDLRGIAEGGYADNEYAVRARMVIDTLADWAHRSGGRFVIHLHPYERYLWDAHGIRPPFADVADGVHVQVSEGSAWGHSNIFDARVGVVTLSSCLYDRLQCGLPTLVFIPEARERRAGWQYYRTRHARSLGEGAFSSGEELTEKLERLLSARVSRDVERATV